MKPRGRHKKTHSWQRLIGGGILALFLLVVSQPDIEQVIRSLWDDSSTTQPATPTNFNAAKQLLRQQVYHDQHRQGALGTLYCGCDWEWTGSSGGQVDLASCGYQIRAQEQRARRIEWEHVVPASWFGHQRQCWQEGGRNHCRKTDPLFSLMEADMHNLSPVIGEVNADRSNFRYGHIAATTPMYGQCTSRTDFSQRLFEPRPEARGLVARIHFYMHDRYDLSLSRQQQQLLMDWDRRYPVTAWELERNRRIRAVVGHDNPFVTGARQWQLGQRNSAEGLPQSDLQADLGQVRGNLNSKIYHLPHCPNYADINPARRTHFKTEQAARQAGYRKARNCQ